MTENGDVMRDLVAANRVLADQDILNAYGHISVRNGSRSDRFFLSRSRSAELVELSDIVEFGPDGEAVELTDVRLYMERYIHAAAYELLPEVNCVLHAHTEAMLPFGVSDVPLVPVIGGASGMGPAAPVWDIADRFGDATNLLVTSMDMGRDLAMALNGSSLALMRGHGFVAVGPTVLSVVRLAIECAQNARVLLAATALGGSVRPLSAGEIATRNSFKFDSARGWESWRARVGY